MKHTYHSRTVLHTYEYTVQYYDKATVVTYTKLEWLLRIYISERLLWHMYTYKVRAVVTVCIKKIMSDRLLWHI